MPIITTYYKNLFSKKRQVKERYIVDENGLKNGLYQSYHRNGQSSETCSFKNGIKHGFCVIKHDNGRIATECTYQDGCLEGSYISYYPDGHKRLECSFKRDRIEGIYRLFNTNGEVEIFYTYHNGVKHGSCEIRRCADEVEKIQYQHNEIVNHELNCCALNLKITRTFEDGKLKTHIRSEYTPDGLLKKKVISSPDFKYSSHELYTDQCQSRPHIRFSCVNDQKDGEYIRLGSYDQPIEICSYKSDKLHGTRKLYFDLEVPILKEKAHYNAGKLDGLCTRYHQNGKIADRCQYCMGKKVIDLQQVQSQFEKQAIKVKREKVSHELISLRRLGKRKEAMVVAQQFHLEKSDIPRRTALKFNKQKSRV